jgi:dihydroorotate dehydrogenase (fumarate)
MSSKTACEYLKIPLASPVIVGACPLTMEPELLRQMIVCGAGAIVLPSIFQEQIADQGELQNNPLSAPEPNPCHPHQQSYNGGPDKYLTIIQEVKRHAFVPVIASMNGYCDGGWLDFAKRIEASGADALELNVQPVITSAQQTAEEIEARLCELLRKVCNSVPIPVAVKMTRHFNNVANMAHRIRLAGAAGVVLFAHELQWEVAIDRLRWTTRWELTPVDSLGATVAGIVQARVGGLDLSLAASGGVRTAEDAVKVMIAGADVVMITSEIYRAGPDAIRKMVHGIERYLETGGFDSIAQFQRSRPVPETRSQRMIRLDYLEPLTRSSQYSDPTPVVEPQTGDRYGHQD